MTEQESSLYSKALSFATEKHAGQRRKDDTSYILHPIRVATFLADHGLDIRYQVAALFHDLLEDTDATESELRNFCDEEMLDAVRFVTKTEGFVESEYIDHILAHPMAKLIKNADRIDNLRDLPNSNDPAFRTQYFEETENYFYGRFSDELDETFEILAERYGYPLKK